MLLFLSFLITKPCAAVRHSPLSKPASPSLVCQFLVFNGWMTWRSPVSRFRCKEWLTYQYERHTRMTVVSRFRVTVVMDLIEISNTLQETLMFYCEKPPVSLRKTSTIHYEKPEKPSPFTSRNLDVLLRETFTFYYKKPPRFTTRNLHILMRETSTFHYEKPSHFTVRNLHVSLWETYTFYCEKPPRFTARNLHVSPLETFTFHCEKPPCFTTQWNVLTTATLSGQRVWTTVSQSVVRGQVFLNAFIRCFSHTLFSWYKVPWTEQR